MNIKFTYISYRYRTFLLDKLEIEYEYDEYEYE